MCRTCKEKYREQYGTLHVHKLMTVREDTVVDDINKMRSNIVDGICITTQTSTTNY